MYCPLKNTAPLRYVQLMTWRVGGIATESTNSIESDSSPSNPIPKDAVDAIGRETAVTGAVKAISRSLEKVKQDVKTGAIDLTGSEKSGIWLNGLRTRVNSGADFLGLGDLVIPEPLEGYEKKIEELIEQKQLEPLNAVAATSLEETSTSTESTESLTHSSSATGGSEESYKDMFGASKSSRVASPTSQSSSASTNVGLPETSATVKAALPPIKMGSTGLLDLDLATPEELSLIWDFFDLTAEEKQTRVLQTPLVQGFLGSEKKRDFSPTQMLQSHRGFLMKRLENVESENEKKSIRIDERIASLKASMNDRNSA